MASSDLSEEIIQMLGVVAAAAAAYTLIRTQTEAAQAAVRQSASAATLELATCANACMLVLGGSPATAPSPSASNVEKLLQALLAQNPGAPVVT